MSGSSFQREGFTPPFSLPVDQKVSGLSESAGRFSEQSRFWSSSFFHPFYDPLFSHFFGHFGSILVSFWGSFSVFFGRTLKTSLRHLIFLFFLDISGPFFKILRMIFSWISDAASQRRAQALQNGNMLKHCSCAVILRIFIFDASMFFLFFSCLSLQRGSTKRQGLCSDFEPVALPKNDEKLSQNEPKNI